MSKSTYRAALLAGLVACLAACAPSGQPAASGTTPPTTSALPWACLSGAVPLAIPTVPTMQAAQVGTGARTVILSNQSDEDACAWRDFASELAGLGYRAVLYDYTNEEPGQDLTAVVQAITTSGATSIALVGASEGAKTSIIIAADSPSVDALVSLSAESLLRGAPVAPYAARLHTPTLFVTADHDAYGATQATQRFYDSAPAKEKKLLIRPGTAHGTALLADADVHQAILDFLASHED